jgi:hypothetical protein
MDVNALRVSFEWYVLYGTLGLSALIGLGGFAHWAFRAFPEWAKRTARRCGAGFVVLFISTSLWAMVHAYPTLEEKEELREQQSRQDAATQSWASVYGAGAAWTECEAVAGSGTASFNPDGACLRDAAQPLQEVPSVCPLSDDDYAAGFALARVGTDESFDFSPPADCEVYEDWRRFGAACDWFRAAFPEGFVLPFGTTNLNAVTVFSFGLTRPSMTDASTFVSPLGCPSGILPASRDGVLADGAKSRFWQARTPSNSLVMTWQDVLLGRETGNLVSFQVEFAEKGDITFRYDLSRLADDIVSNVVVGGLNGGAGRTFAQLSRNTTSLRWARLDPLLADDPDPDGDGLSTADEVLVYGTDPYAADSDKDGIGDCDEVNETGTDPNAPHSLSALFCDGIAVKIGDLDPFSCPEGSTNTVLEHVFYSGTTNGAFAYPQSSDDVAVMKIMVSGTGAGDLVVGDEIVPLVAPTPQSASRMMRSADESVRTNTLLKVLGKGARLTVWLMNKPEGLDVAIDSDDFFIGRKPTALLPRGWVAFPHTDATVPCIHDFNASGKTVSLIHGVEFDGLTATWSSDGTEVAITNLPPVAAEVHGHFSKGETRTISYQVGHPQQLNGAPAVFTQTLRFCPQLGEEEISGGSGGGAGEDDDDYWPCTCSSEGSCPCCGGEWCACPNCDCPCEKNQPPALGDDDEEDEEAFTNIVNGALRPLSDVLYLYRANAKTEHLEVPGGTPVHCCPCPEHWGTNYVAKAYASSRVAVVGSDGGAFGIAYEPCDVAISGVSPSRSFGDAPVLFVTNGASYKRTDCTVLGVKIERPEGCVPLSTYNQKSASFGFPVTLCTNLEDACSLILKTDVLLSEGMVRVALDEASGAFQVALPGWWDDAWNWHDPEVLLDSESHAERYLTIRKWRSILRRYGASRELEVKILSSAPGSCNLKVEYAASNGAGCVHDFADQRLTSVKPSLLPDYNRDGSIDDQDITNHLAGTVYRFWKNEDTVKGDFIGASDDSSRNADDLVVNGTYDLVNLFSVALDLGPFVRAWGRGVTCMVRPEWGEADAFNFCLAEVPWDRAGSIQTAGVKTLSGQDLSSATLTELPAGGVELQGEELTRFSENSGLMICEATKLYASLSVEIRCGNETLYSYSVPMTIVPVEEMYRNASLRDAADDPSVSIAVPEVPSDQPDGTKDLDVFFLHGFNVNADAARAWGVTVFKRLWQAGSNARFHILPWRGNYSWSSGETFNGLHYQHNVWFAQRTGGALKRYIEAAQPDPSRRILMTQSLGNMVACEALREGLRVGQYYMFDAAVAAEAIDGTLRAETPEDAPFGKYVRPEWRDYTPDCWTANWYRLFADVPDDARRQMSWENRFSDALTNATEVFNYYSSGDSVFTETEEIPTLLTDVTHWGVGWFLWVIPYPTVEITFENHCWQKQEVLKGMATAAGTLSGGWGFNVWQEYDPLLQEFRDVRYSPEGAAAAVADHSITNRPAFDVHDAGEMMNPRASEDDVFLALAKHVPALSSPVGGNPVLEGEDRNVDMNLNNEFGGVPRPNEWGRNHPVFGASWLHSDMKDMAYFYVYKLYEQLIQKGNLR